MEDTTEYPFLSPVKTCRGRFIKLPLNGWLRLAMALGLSLMVHLSIFYGVSWSPAGDGHMPLSGRLRGGEHRLTITIADAPRTSTPGRQEGVAADKREAPAVKEINKTGQIVPAATDSIFSTALETRYFSLAELDQHPVIKQDIAENPPELSGYPQGGEVVLRLWIDDTGHVTKVDTISSNLPQPFIDSARAGFLQAVFSPGRKQGVDVATVMEVAVSYAQTPVNPAATAEKILR